MKKRWARMLAVFMAAAGMMLSCISPAAAYVEDDAQQEAAVDGTLPGEKGVKEKTAGSLEEETPERLEPTPFSMPGNAELVDDAGDDETKQFLAVQTKNGNVFYIVVDRSGSTENVYMMSLVDENDIKEFIEEESGGDTDGQGIMQTVPGLETSADTETGGGQEKQEDEDKEHKKGTGMGGIIPVLLVFGGCAAGIYYFKVLRPEKEADEDSDDDVGFFDEYEAGQKEEPEIEE